MSWNDGYERRKFEARQKKQAEEYRALANSILECASEKFDCCSIEVNDELTQLILEMFAEATGFNEELIAQTVEQIIIDENGKIKLRVKSGVEIKGDI